MTPKLTELQKALNKQIKERHYKNFKSFKYENFKNNVEAIELFKLYEQAINARKSIGTTQMLSQKPIWDFKAKVDQYIKKNYAAEINHTRPLPEQSDMPKEEQYNSLEEFIKSMQVSSSNKTLIEHASTFIENYNNRDYTKQMSFHGDFVTPLIIKNIKELFGINDDYIAKQLIHLNYSHIPYLDEYKDKINTWSIYCKFVNNLIDFIQSTYTAWDKMDKKEKKAILTLHDILQNTYFRNNPEYLLEVEGFISEYGLNGKKRAKKEKLISLNLPKITPQIADKLLTISSKNKF